jgi:hypothetical protein
MTVDKFGRSSFHLQQKHGFFRALHEEEEVIDAKKRRIINVETPIDTTDSANKVYVDDKVSEINLLSYDLSDLYSTNELDPESAKKVQVYTTIVKDSLKKYFFEDKNKLVTIISDYINSHKSSPPSVGEDFKVRNTHLTLHMLLEFLSRWIEKK